LYDLEIQENTLKTFQKLLKKDRKQWEALNSKIEQIRAHPYQFKPLKHPMEGRRRVHIGSFVLIYRILEDSKTVRIVQYCHHDKAY